MPNNNLGWRQIRVQAAALAWLDNIARRARVGRHRVLSVLLDEYERRLPVSTRERVEALLTRWRTPAN